jgi:CO/xanthine dehydrogenase Mo-binding subunit
MAGYEEVKYTPKGRMMSDSLLYYKIPTNGTVGKLTTEFAQSYEQSGPFGAKSVGEIGIDTPPAALCNAVENALGVRIDSLPVTPEKIYKALQALKYKEQ